MKQILPLFLLVVPLLLAGCEICDDPNGCLCYMDNDHDGEGDSTTGRPAPIEEGEMCPEGYYIEES